MAVCIHRDSEKFIQLYTLETFISLELHLNEVGGQASLSHIRHHHRFLYNNMCIPCFHQKYLESKRKTEKCSFPASIYSILSIHVPTWYGRSLKSKVKHYKLGIMLYENVKSTFMCFQEILL